MPFVSKATDDAEKSQYVIGFSKGLNTVQEGTLVNDKNLTQATNVSLAVDGITKRSGTLKPWDQGGATKVWGSSAFYNKVTGVRKYVRVANGKLQYLNGAVWSNIGTTAFTNATTHFIQARNKLYCYNGTDKLRTYDGTDIAEYTELTTPTNLAITPTGTAGTTTYSYRVSAFNATGETLSCSQVSTTTGNATLSLTDYNKLDWTAVANATGYNVYGRTVTGYGHCYIATVYSNTYNDVGITLTTTKLPPDGNNTGGIIAKGGVFASGRQFVYGATEGGVYYPTRIYYSGTLNYIDSFVGGEYGGGWVEVYSNDGGEIVDVQPYQNGVLIWKTNGLFKFYFTASGSTIVPALQEVTREHGGVSGYGSQTMGNDYVYVGQKGNRLAVMTVGQQQNYVGDQLRTNELSIFFSNQLSNANRSKISQVATWMFNDTFGFTYTSGTNTENDRGYVLDTRFGGWVYWTGLPMKATHYSVYDDGTNVKLYGGSNLDGYMIEMFYATKSDNGVAYRSVAGTKFYNANIFDVDKIWRNPTLWFKYITGGTALTLETWVDGNQLLGTTSVMTEQSGAGAGADLMGNIIPGVMSNTLVTVTANTDVPVEMNLISMSRSIGFYVIDENAGSDWLFMGLHLTFTPLYGKPASGVQKVNIT